ncbi:MAG: WXG100 family type VII secretion target, partial [Trebonia sp.]
MAFVGLDPEQVAQIARKLDSQQRRIDAVGSAVDAAVRGARGVWKGPDVDRFAADWSGTHRASLRAAGQAIAELASKARSNAAQQVVTSNNYGGGMGTGPVGTIGMSPIFAQVKNLFNGVDYTASGSAFAGWAVDAHGHTTLGGIPVSGHASGTVGLGAAGSAHLHTGPGGVDASAVGNFYDGAKGSLDGQIGTKDYNVHGHMDGFVGVKGGGGAHLLANGDGVSYGAHGQVFDGAEASQQLGVHTPYGLSSITATEQVGAGANGSIGAAFGKDGFSEHAGGGFFVGAQEGFAQKTQV